MSSPIHRCERCLREFLPGDQALVLSAWRWSAPDGHVIDEDVVDRRFCSSCERFALMGVEWAVVSPLLESADPRDAHIEQLESAVGALLLFPESRRPFRRPLPEEQPYPWADRIRQPRPWRTEGDLVPIGGTQVVYSDRTTTTYRELAFGERPIEHIVHVIRSGVANCGAGPPERWTDAERWTWLDSHANDITCSSCICLLPEHIHRARREALMACGHTFPAHPGSDPTGSQVRCQLTRGHRGECAAGGDEEAP